MRRGLHAIECRCALCEAVWGRLCREVSEAGRKRFQETPTLNPKHKVAQKREQAARKEPV